MDNDVAMALPEVPPALAPRLEAGGAVAWSEAIGIRTYEAGAPDPYPLFVNRRVYQGSSGRVYPIPFIDRVEKTAHERSWQAIHLENTWIRLMILPELGGRIHVGYDKTADYDFFYRNNVIKPALVGLAGPWVSGGVEFNWPQHHRPATYLPVCTQIEEGADGSVTVWCSDHDPFARMRGTHGIRLHPDRAVVEVEVKLHNRTSTPQTFLWWANAAAHVDENYEAFFPTDVHHVADHARRAVTAYPRADRPYYGYDYSTRHDHGGDRIDRYVNIPVPTSYMVTGTQDDFFGGYDHGREAGFVHVADHRISPGKKLWTWGNAPFGHAWDRQLTDSDGPYVELMAGVYTDNQPDFAWLDPGETKTFCQTWFPFQRIGPVQQANVEAACSLQVFPEGVRAGIAVTRPRARATVRITAGGAVLHEEELDLAPGTPWLWESRADRTPGATGLDPGDVAVTLEQGGARILVWRSRKDDDADEPEIARIPPLPHDVESNDELHRIGVHLQQYRHPTRDALPYFEEALRRDPEDVRCLQALGTDRLRRGLYIEADDYLDRAWKLLTRYNASPPDGEIAYLRGLLCVRTGRDDEALDAFAKAAWNRRWEGPAFVELARMAGRAGDHREALRCGLRAAEAAPDDARARVLQSIHLRALGRDAEAGQVLEETLRTDPLDPTALYLRHGTDALAGLDGRTLLDVGHDLGAAGAEQDAFTVYELAAGRPAAATGESRPLAHYHRALLHERRGRQEAAAAARADARSAPAELCFPAGLDDHDALTATLEAEPDDGRAAELLGMLLFDARRPAEALGLWRRAVSLGTAGAITLRNAALATFIVAQDGEEASALYDQAISVRADSRLLYEADQLRARLGVDPGRRLEMLDAHRERLLERDDVTVEYCTLLIADGRLDEARSILMSRHFAPWEGGEGKVVAAWEALQLAAADACETTGDLDGAIEAVRDALDIPRNLGEDRHPLADTTRTRGRLAHLFEKAGRVDEARAERSVARTASAVVPVHEDGSIDYFATSLPDLLLFPED